MRFSFSRIDCFKQCPFKYRCRYVDRLKTIPEQNADNALWLGSGLHKGIETTPEEGVLDYQAHYYVLTNEVINWSLQLEYWAQKAWDVLPEGGQHEIPIETDDFIGYIDYVCGDTLFDFKWSNAIDSYLKPDKARQLSLYKYYYELENPGQVINHLKFVFFPKSKIRQRKTETVTQFRERLYDTLGELKIQVIEIPYDADSITDFLEERKRIETATEYPKQLGPFCERFCEFYGLCQKGDCSNIC